MDVMTKSGDLEPFFILLGSPDTNDINNNNSNNNNINNLISTNTDDNNNAKIDINDLSDSLIEQQQQMIVSVNKGLIIDIIITIIIIIIYIFIIIIIIYYLYYYYYYYYKVCNSLEFLSLMLDEIILVSKSKMFKTFETKRDNTIDIIGNALFAMASIVPTTIYGAVKALGE